MRQLYLSLTACLIFTFALSNCTRVQEYDKEVAGGAVGAAAGAALGAAIAGKGDRLEGALIGGAVGGAAGAVGGWAWRRHEEKKLTASRQQYMAQNTQYSQPAAVQRMRYDVQQVGFEPTRLSPGQSVTLKIDLLILGPSGATVRPIPVRIDFYAPGETQARTDQTSATFDAQGTWTFETRFEVPQEAARGQYKAVIIVTNPETGQQSSYDRYFEVV